MGALNDAFNRRIGKKDHDSFIEVVNAFFEEAQQNEAFIIPFHFVQDSKGDMQFQPVFILSSKGEAMLTMVTDAEYMRYFNNGSHLEIEAIKILQLLRDDATIAGIIINPFSEYHCYLPREDTITIARELELL